MCLICYHVVYIRKRRVRVYILCLCTHVLVCTYVDVCEHACMYVDMCVCVYRIGNNDYLLAKDLGNLGIGLRNASYF